MSKDGDRPIKILILGSSCPQCDALMDNTRAALRELSLDAEIEHVGKLIDILSYGVMTTPSLLINHCLVSEGRLLSVKEIKEHLLKFSADAQHEPS